MTTYQKPETEIILPMLKDLMQGGITDASGENGPGVDPDNPIDDPNDPNAGLLNRSLLWEDWQ